MNERNKVCKEIYSPDLADQWRPVLPGRAEVERRGPAGVPGGLGDVFEHEHALFRREDVRRDHALHELVGGHREKANFWEEPTDLLAEVLGRAGLSFQL